MNTPPLLSVAERAALRIERTRQTQLGKDAIDFAVTQTSDEDLREAMLSLFESPRATLKVAKNIQKATHPPTAKELAQFFVEADSSSDSDSDSKSEITFSSSAYSGTTESPDVPPEPLPFMFQVTGIPFGESIYPLQYRLDARAVPLQEQFQIHFRQTTLDAIDITSDHFKAMDKTRLRATDDRSKRQFSHDYSAYQAAGGTRDILSFVPLKVAMMLGVEADPSRPFMSLPFIRRIHLVLRIKKVLAADKLAVIAALRALAGTESSSLDYEAFLLQQARVQEIFCQYPDVVPRLKLKTLIETLLAILPHKGMKAILAGDDYANLADLTFAICAYALKLHTEQEGKAQETEALALMATSRIDPSPVFQPAPPSASTPVQPKKGDRRDRGYGRGFKAASAEAPADSPETVIAAATKAPSTAPDLPFNAPQFRGKTNPAGTASSRCINCNFTKGSARARNHLTHDLIQCQALCSNKICFQIRTNTPDLDGADHMGRKCKILWSPVGVDLQNKLDAEVCHPANFYRSPSTKTSSSRSNSIPALKSRPLPKKRANFVAQFDPGSNAFVGPHIPLPIEMAPVAAVSIPVELPNGDTCVISGIQQQPCGSVFHVCPEFETNLVPASYLANNGVSALISEDKLYLLNTTASNEILSTLQESPSDIISVIPSTNGLFYFTADEFASIAKSHTERDEDFDPYFPPPKSAAVKRYHTVTYPTLQSLVIYWHTVWRHCSLQQMLSIVQNKLFDNIPSQLTEDVIRKHFPHTCTDCSLGNIQLQSTPAPKVFDDTVPVGAKWQMDFKIFKGSDAKRIQSIGGNSYSLTAIDYKSGRVWGKPTRSRKLVVQHFKELHEFNRLKGYVMTDLSVDDEFATDALKYACKQLHVTLHVAIPSEHFGIGDIERFHRNLHEGLAKAKASKDWVTPDMWAMGYNREIDMYNCLPNHRNPQKSAYEVYDKVRIDLDKTPMLPMWTHVVAHIPLSQQSMASGGLRGLRLVYIGRGDDFGGCKLFNPLTNMCVIRRSLKVMGDHPVNGLLFSTDIVLADELTEQEHAILTNSDTDSLPPVPPTSQQASDLPTDLTDNISIPDLDPPEVTYDYRKAVLSQAHHSQRHYFARIGTVFVEKARVVADITIAWRIQSVVTLKEWDRTKRRHSLRFFYQYYDISQPVPVDDEDFEYSPCSEVLSSRHYSFESGTLVANSLKKAQIHNYPTSWASLLLHDERDGFMTAALDELGSYWDNGCVGEQPGSFDWTTVDPKSVGDLMFIFDKKYKPDMTFDKYKCRLVFRGDRWRNVQNLPTYSSSMEHDALMMILAVAATEDLDLHSCDVKTAFLYGEFPENVEQWVRSPHGLPPDLLPRKFQLLKCVYGHPLANQRFQEYNEKILFHIGFRPLVSTPSVYTLDRNGERMILGIVTDDFVMAQPFGSTIKQYVLDQIAEHYVITTKDPLQNFVGMHFTRDRTARTITIKQPQFLSSMAAKYPLPEDASFPDTPMAVLSPFLSVSDDALSQQPLDALRLTEYQSLVGDISWVGFHTRPDVLFALNVVSRRSLHPSELDWKVALRIAHYLIGTNHLGIVLGGPLGIHLIATVDSSYATHDDMKSHSSWSVHMGGAFITKSKKQSIMTDSSTFSELVGAHLAIKDIMWARNFLSEIGYPLLVPTTLFIDNQSTLKIIANKTFSGKTRHLDIRYNMIRELVATGDIKPAYLCTSHMISDMGTKPLAKGPFLYLRDLLLGYSTLDEFSEVL